MGRDPMNDVALAESLVITMRAAVIREMTTNSEVQKPSMESILGV